MFVPTLIQLLSLFKITTMVRDFHLTLPLDVLASLAWCQIVQMGTQLINVNLWIELLKVPNVRVYSARIARSRCAIPLLFTRSLSKRSSRRVRLRRETVT
jgi:hypothetical protein